MSQRRGTWLKKAGVVLLINIFLVTATIALFEAFGRRFVPEHELYLIDDVDHRMKPREDPEINSDGIRSLVEADLFKEEDVNVIFLGDSFVFGYDLPYRFSIPHMLQFNARKLNPQKRINVANFAWVSSSPLLSMRLLKDIGEKYKPDTVLLAIDMTDFHDDIKYARLFERKGIYRALDIAPITVLTLKKAISIAKLDSLHEAIFGFPRRRYFITDGPLEETRQNLSHILRNIQAINAYAKDVLGARFILFVFPRSYQYSDQESPKNWEKDEYQVLGPYAHEPFKFFEEIRDEVDYPIFSLLPDFQNTELFPTVFDDDPHWNPFGTMVAVDAIYQYCNQADCFEQKP